jgi:hypothetical protein
MKTHRSRHDVRAVPRPSLLPLRRLPSLRPLNLISLRSGAVWAPTLPRRRFRIPHCLMRVMTVGTTLHRQPRSRTRLAAPLHAPLSRMREPASTSSPSTSPSCSLPIHREPSTGSLTHCMRCQTLIGSVWCGGQRPCLIPWCQQTDRCSLCATLSSLTTSRPCRPCPPPPPSVPPTSHIPRPHSCPLSHRHCHLPCHHHLPLLCRRNLLCQCFQRYRQCRQNHRQCPQRLSLAAHESGRWLTWQRSASSPLWTTRATKPFT